MEEKNENFSKIENKNTAWVSNPTSWNLSKRIETSVSISVHSFCYCSTVAKSQHMESVQVAISKWMDAQTSVYVKIE